MEKTTPTPGPWRIGDAGHTVFGPPNGNPAPVVVATCRRPDDTRTIVTAVNAHAALRDALAEIAQVAGSIDARKESIAALLGILVTANRALEKVPS